jgi:alpha-maltose-1-phosphate synthase
MRVGLVAQAETDIALDLAVELHGIGTSVVLYLSHAHVTRGIGISDRTAERLYELGLVPSECEVRLFNFFRRRDLRSFTMIRRLAQAMRDDRLDVAHLIVGNDEFWLAGLACLLRHMPVTSTMVLPEPNIGESTSVVWASNKLLASASDMVIVNGASQVALIQKVYGTPTERVSHIPLGARTTSVSFGHKAPAEKPGMVLFFGSADPYKGLEFLVRAEPLITQMVPYARIVIVSHGADLARYRRMIKNCNQIEIHEEYVLNDEMAHFFERSSVVVLPYLSASTSGVLLTAYGFGKPVVATRVGCLPEYVQDGITGLLVPPSDIEHLASAVVSLLLNDSCRHRMGESAKHWVDEQRSKIAGQTQLVYEKAMHRYENRRR